jgi:L-ribulokinase
MGGKRDGVYTPDPVSADVYDDLYAEYVRLHDYFGRGPNEVMHRLRDLRDRVLAAEPGAAQSGAARPGAARPDAAQAGAAQAGAAESADQETPSPEGSQR